MSLRDDYSKRVSAVDREIAAERQQADEEEIEEREDEWDLRRLDAGLFCFQVSELERLRTPLMSALLTIIIDFGPDCWLVSR